MNPAANEILTRLGLWKTNSGAGCGQWIDDPAGGEIASCNPADGSELARVRLAAEEDYDEVLWQARLAFDKWRLVPAPKRGEIVREIGEELRRVKDDLGALVTLESGKILAEGRGEVQEMIDIADFACGLSRQLYGLSMHSERPGHRMYEQWHPLGVVGVITAFNFPVAVWAWNALIALICGDVVVWKPSLKTPLCAIAVQRICDRVLARNGQEDGWKGVANVVIGTDECVGKRLTGDRRVPLISATGSSRMGRIIGPQVAGRLGRTLLELGGNNGIIVTDDADPELVVRAVLFGAVGTAGQRCTSTRRLFLQRGIAPRIIERLVAAYKQVRIGNPMDPATLMGPLIDGAAVDHMLRALAMIEEQGGKVIAGGGRLNTGAGNFVEPTLVLAAPHMPCLKDELFAPVLYLIEYDDLEQAIAWHNDVPQGLSSAIFTRDLRSSETFLSARGSDCGIANVNIGTSGAEIGGAFGGEKDTGGGRESGSDAWKAYMRRQTVTVNWSDQLPLAQGIQFELP
ncbi:MAG TPA: aldehyde dehydrogenase family protein [Bryobacteraceae bacterium]|nr:aldehyde dehydrogenase family protein [Bryobacteraceae bacterium]